MSFTLSSDEKTRKNVGFQLSQAVDGALLVYCTEFQPGQCVQDTVFFSKGKCTRGDTWRLTMPPTRAGALFQFMWFSETDDGVFVFQGYTSSTKREETSLEMHHWTQRQQTPPLFSFSYSIDTLSYTVDSKLSSTAIIDDSRKYRRLVHLKPGLGLDPISAKEKVMTKENALDILIKYGRECSRKLENMDHRLYKRQMDAAADALWTDVTRTWHCGEMPMNVMAFYVKICRSYLRPGNELYSALLHWWHLSKVAYMGRSYLTEMERTDSVLMLDLLVLVCSIVPMMLPFGDDEDGVDQWFPLSAHPVIDNSVHDCEDAMSWALFILTCLRDDGHVFKAGSTSGEMELHRLYMVLQNYCFCITNMTAMNDLQQNTYHCVVSAWKRVLLDGQPAKPAAAVLEFPDMFLVDGTDWNTRGRAQRHMLPDTKELIDAEEKYFINDRDLRKQCLSDSYGYLLHIITADFNLAGIDFAVCSAQNPTQLGVKMADLITNGCAGVAVLKPLATQTPELHDAVIKMLEFFPAFQKIRFSGVQMLEVPIAMFSNKAGEKEQVAFADCHTFISSMQGKERDWFRNCLQNTSYMAYIYPLIGNYTITIIHIGTRKNAKKKLSLSQ